MVVLDVYTSLVAISLVAWLGGLVAQTLRLPRIVFMILFGIALYPSLHPSILVTGVSPNPSVWNFDSQGGAQNPASSIRTMALLIALIRGGLSVKVSFFRDFAVATALLAVVPYFVELSVEALLAPLWIPKFYGTAPAIAAWESASIWAPLSPSIVIPNMLKFVEDGLTEAGRVVLTGAPLEVSTALIFEGVLDGIVSAETAHKSSTDVLGHIPTFIIGSILYGVAFALAFRCYVYLRENAKFVTLAGKPDKTEHLLVFVMLSLLCYTTSIDSVDVPWLIGFFSCVCCAIATQYLLPAMADTFCLSLKPAWFFAEGFLFVLTGCVIRPAMDQADLASALFGNLLAVLVVGSLARMAADVLVGVAWQCTVCGTSPFQFSRDQWADVARRTAFIWMATTPKATLQGTLGPKVGKTFAKAAEKLDPSYGPPSQFVAAGAAVSILYMATIGSLMTFSAGVVLAQYFQKQAAAAEGAATGESADGLAELGEPLVAPLKQASEIEPAAHYRGATAAQLELLPTGLGASYH